MLSIQNIEINSDIQSSHQKHKALFSAVWHLLSIMEVESSETKITRDKATTDEANEGGKESKQLMAKQNTGAPVWKHFSFEVVKSRNLRLCCP